MSARAPVFLCLHRYLCLNPGIYTATVPCLSVCAAGGLLPAGRLVTIASASPGGQRKPRLPRRTARSRFSAPVPVQGSGRFSRQAAASRRNMQSVFSCPDFLTQTERRNGLHGMAGKKKARRIPAGGVLTVGISWLVIYF